MRLSIIFSKSFPVQSIRHSGLYEEGASGGLSPFLMSTSHALFHAEEILPSSRHLLYNLSNVSGWRFTITFSTSLLMLSIPGAILFLSELAALVSPPSEILGACSCIHDLRLRSGCTGKRPLTMLWRLLMFWISCGGRFLISFPITSL